MSSCCSVTSASLRNSCRHLELRLPSRWGKPRQRRRSGATGKNRRTSRRRRSHQLHKENSMPVTEFEAPSTPKERVRDWTKPAAMAIPKEGYVSLKNGRYGPIYPRTTACHGFTIIAKNKPGRVDT